MAVPTENKALSAARKLVPCVDAEFPGAELCLFGSVARGDATEASDIDVGIIIDSYGRYTPLELATKEARISLGAFALDDRIETVVRTGDDASGMGPIIQKTGILVS